MEVEQYLWFCPADGYQPLILPTRRFRLLVAAMITVVVAELWERAFIHYNAVGVYWFFVSFDAGLTLLVLLISGLASLLGALVLFPIGIIQLIRRKPIARKSLVRAGAALLLGLVLTWCILHKVLFNGVLHHTDSVRTQNRAYYLAEYLGVWDLPALRRYGLYECDSLGIVCHLKFDTSLLEGRASLTYSPATNVLLVTESGCEFRMGGCDLEIARFNPP
jgi:hypothetical protein